MCPSGVVSGTSVARRSLMYVSFTIGSFFFTFVFMTGLSNSFQKYTIIKIYNFFLKIIKCECYLSPSDCIIELIFL